MPPHTEKRRAAGWWFDGRPGQGLTGGWYQDAPSSTAKKLPLGMRARLSRLPGWSRTSGAALQALLE
jgi:hypothetical protein